MILRDRPGYSALSGATENNPYAELGIMGISIHESQFSADTKTDTN